MDLCRIITITTLVITALCLLFLAAQKNPGSTVTPSWLAFMMVGAILVLVFTFWPEKVDSNRG